MNTKIVTNLRKQYDRSVDYCFWLSLLMFIPPLLRNIGIISYQLVGAAEIIKLLATIIVYFATIVVILARPLRDEYAEQLWTSAAKSYVKIMILLPLCLTLLAATFEPQLIEYLKHVGADDTFLGSRRDLRSVGYYELSGAVKLTAVFVTFFPMIFLGLYKWQRWKNI